MDKWMKRSVELLTSLSFGKDGDVAVIPYYPQKIEISGSEAKYFRRTTPESAGVSSKRLYNMLCELESERRSNIHNLLILRDGEVICECSRDGYSSSVWHLSHSMSKTVTGMAIGMLWDEGKINLTDKLCELFPEVPYKDKKFAQITVEHLLSMQSGVPFAEAGAVTETGWTEAFFASGLNFTPGTSFAYNSMNSYILARIVCRVTGQSLTQFLEQKLFSPLHISNYYWEVGPEGVEKGGWGLFLSAESWAKLGQMILDRGVFEGKRILSEEWVECSTKLHAIAPMIDGDFNYAYQMWVGRNTEEILFNGMLGQNVWICPKNRFVVAINSGNNELFQLSPTLDIIRKYLGCEIEDETVRSDVRALRERESRFYDSRRWVRPLEKRRGLRYFLHLRSRYAFDERWEPILGEYRVMKNNVSVLPLFVISMQNNFKAGIDRFELLRQGDELIFAFREGGEEYAVNVGLYGYRRQVLEFRGERYVAEVMGEALSDAGGAEEFRIEFVFPEMPNTRMIRFRLLEDGCVDMVLMELPNNRIVDKVIESVSETNALARFAIGLLEKRYGEGFLEKKAEEVFTPRLTAVSTLCPECDKILEAANARAAEESIGVRFVRAVVGRFFKESVGIAEINEVPKGNALPVAGEKKKDGLFARLFNKKEKASADLEPAEDEAKAKSDAAQSESALGSAESEAVQSAGDTGSVESGTTQDERNTGLVEIEAMESESALGSAESESDADSV